MPIITQIVCDGCQAVKKEVNHWYALTATEQGAYLQPLEQALQHHSDTHLPSELKYLCGRLCATEALTHWMDTLHTANQAQTQETEAGQQVVTLLKAC